MGERKEFYFILFSCTFLTFLVILVNGINKYAETTYKIIF